MSGRILTFYSWKGGVGRTMAVANVGVQLARRGKRVLLVDWDLEAPGLDRYFQSTDTPDGSQLSVKWPADCTGLLGVLADASLAPERDLLPDMWRRRCVQIEVPKMPGPHRVSSGIIHPEPLHVLVSGLRSADYAKCLQEFSWTSFFAERKGAHFLEELRSQWRDAYDVVLIDSRTGLTDSGGVCTVQMPDILVLVFTANAQSLEDGLAFLKGVDRARAGFAVERAPLTVVPLLGRWEGDREVDLADKWLERMRPLVAPLVETWYPRDLPVRLILERLRVPHVARFSFGEPLPVLTHSLTDPSLPGLAYDLLAELIASGFSNAGEIIDPGYRPRFVLAFASKAEIDRLVMNDKEREAAIGEVMESQGPDSPASIGFLLDLADGGIRVGRLEIAENLTKSAIVKAHNVHRSPGTARRLLSRGLVLHGDIRLDFGDVAEALLAYREALETAQAALADRSDGAWWHDLSVSYDRIGDALWAQGDLVRALESYQASVDSALKLVAWDSSNPAWRRDLSTGYYKIGDALQAQGDLVGALSNYQASVDIERNLAASDSSEAIWQRGLSVGYNKIGEVRQAQGDLPGALEYYRTATEIVQKLTALDPSNAALQRHLSACYDNIGDVLQAQGDLAGALSCYQAGMAIAQKLAATDSYNATWRRDLSVGHDNIGSVLQAQGDLVGALMSYRAGMEIARKLAAADASNATWQRDLSVGYDNIGEVLQAQGDLAGALENYQAGMTIRQKLAAADSHNTEWQRDLSVSYDKIGEVLRQQGDLAGALEKYQAGIAIRQKLAADDPSNTQWLRDLSASYDEVATMLKAQGNLDAALEND